jgi:hypothetical protein
MTLDVFPVHLATTNSIKDTASRAARIRFCPFQNPNQGFHTMNTWPLGIAATAAQTSTRTIRRWLDNGVIKLKRGQDVMANGSGSYCGLSRNRILQIALAQNLIAAGMARSRAASAALAFTDMARRGPVT